MDSYGQARHKDCRATVLCTSHGEAIRGRNVPAPGCGGQSCCSHFKGDKFITMTSQTLPEYIDGLPNICGSEEIISETMTRPKTRSLPQARIDPGRIQSAFAIALHMHQPL